MQGGQAKLDAMLEAQQRMADQSAQARAPEPAPEVPETVWVVGGAELDGRRLWTAAQPVLVGVYVAISLAFFATHWR